MMQASSAATPRKFPAFVFPTDLKFYLEDQSSHKQILTLYNPYDFPIKFKVLCTAPNKYKVVDPEGTIKAKCCVDLVVRHTALLISNCNVTDKFRVHMQEHPNKQATGKRDVEATLLPGVAPIVERATPDPETFQQLPINGARQQQSYSLITQNRTINSGTNYVAVIAGIVCIAGLLLPTEGEARPSVPDYLHLSINFKLIFSFVLGMVTMITFRL
ncbi:PREDICTED: motile sperm domain-containing protein 1-like isoform X2 [Polistes dominula]|uniref:Motile sperm domain-containing protein 1-like isoform X2 n=1 Tax=Polistes dominula TaxID=743375 RepID=A0ABM1HUU5_POLDO|nr:PREDICTED: motile sperm domain-containing protein 1-like isoform X2 [Polistes dominula]